jgi:O-antigen ligase
MSVARDSARGASGFGGIATAAGVGGDRPQPVPRAAYAAAKPEGRARVGFDDAVFWAFMAGLAWVPFWFGSNVLLAWGINALIFPGLAVLFEMPVLAGRRPHPVAVKRIALPAVLFVATVVWIVVQCGQWLPRELQHPIWRLAADALAVPVKGSISASRDLTAQALLRLMTSASVFWLALQLGRDGMRANRIMVGIAAIIVVYASYGLVAYAATPGYVLWFENRAVTGYVASTFYNRDNFATYAGIGVILMFGLLLRLYRVRLQDAGPGRLRIAAFIDTTGRGGAIYICGLFIILTALLLTASRGAIVSTAFAGLAFAAMAFGRSRTGAIDQRDVLIFLAFIVAAIFAGFGDTILGKIGQQGFGDESRLAVYRLTVGSILDRPLLGHGYGTFADVFPMFRDRSTGVSGAWVMAHNTYLELFQGLGLVFGALLIIGIGALALRCLKGATTRKVNATLPALAAGVACLIAVNALVDFSLQIQAVTLTFMAVLGVGVAQSDSSQRGVED